MLTFRTVIAALTFATLSAGALAQDVTVMISGGFKAALEKLTPQYEAQSGDRLIVISGPSMGKTPQAIPARLARGEKADVVIMVGDALAKLEQDRRTAA
ncbi:molybdenum ABC transporter substrate-binding protein, partial [Enterobacter cloacae complex sp. 3DZ3S2B]